MVDVICYRDTTFCNVGEGCTCPPHLRLTEAVKAEARDWWEGDNAPIATAALCKPDKATPAPEAS